MEINSLQDVTNAMKQAGITIHPSTDEIRYFAEAIYCFMYDIDIEDLITLLKENVYGSSEHE